MRRLVVVGSSDLWALPEIGATIAGHMVTMPPGSEIGIRVSMDGSFASQVEHCAWLLATKMHFTVRPFPPEPGGRDKVYRRDFDMVEWGEGVVAFFHPVITGGGTSHVVKAAIDRDKQVDTYSLDDEGRVVAVERDE